MDEVREEVSPAARVGAPPSGPSAPRRAFFWSVIVTIGVVASLATGELTVRILGARPGMAQDELDRKLALSKRTEVSVVTTGDLAGLIQPSDVPGVIYELKPSRRWRFQGALTQTNEHGFRGADWAVAKGPSTLRVVGIGDSVMFGWGVDEAATYMSRLERMIEVPGRTVEVLNCAVPGYNTSQEVATLGQRCLRFEPDVIVLVYCTNDWAAPFFVKDPARGGLIESSVLLSWIEERRRERARRYFERSPMACLGSKRGWPCSTRKVWRTAGSVSSVSLISPPRSPRRSSVSTRGRARYPSEPKDASRGRFLSRSAPRRPD